MITVIFDMIKGHEVHVSDSSHHFPRFNVVIVDISVPVG